MSKTRHGPCPQKAFSLVGETGNKHVNKQLYHVRWWVISAMEHTAGQGGEGMNQGRLEIRWSGRASLKRWHLCRDMEEVSGEPRGHLADEHSRQRERQIQRP